MIRIGTEGIQMEGSMTVRPHHALCARFFVGKGYSEAFVQHMYATLRALNDGAVVTLTDGCDAICAGCPNNRGGICEHDEKGRAIDRRSLCETGLAFGQTLSWRDLSALMRERIVLRDALKTVCRDCEWIALCESRREAEKER